MDIKEIHDPSFLKGLSIPELEELCQDIRDFLIDNVSKTGGHLSSNLGTVELTVAMHKVFNSPRDQILFDVGHQAYTHKILTGRSKLFPSLRQTNGLSGFQKMSESEHDPFEAGHAGTALSTALGLAIARDYNQRRGEVIAFVGDGSLTNGMCYEALNNIGNSHSKVIIIINDNNMSISKNVGSLSDSFAKLSISKPYKDIKKDVVDVLNKGGILTKPLVSGIRGLKNVVKKNIVSSSIFDEFGLKYVGVYDGHNLRDIIKALEYAKNLNQSVVVHFKTIKGKGYSLSEVDQKGLWHGVSQFDPNTGETNSSLPEGILTYSAIVSETLVRLAKENNNIVVITPAMIVGSKLEKFFKMYPTRSFDTGITEEHAMTFAAGLALGNLHPFISIYSTFLQRAYDQINHDVTRMNLPVVIGVDRAGIVGEDGETHHGLFDIGILKPLPNLTIMQPKDANETQNLLYSAFEYRSPVAIRYPRGNDRFQPVKEFEYIKKGSWELLKVTEQQPEVILFTYGQEVLNLYHKAEQYNYPWWIVNMRFLKPIDEALLEKLFSEHNCLFYVVESDYIIGGMAESILSFKNKIKNHHDVRVIGVENHYIEHGSMSALRKLNGIDTNTIISTILKDLGKEID